jgi:WD40 repeat protein
MWFSPIVRTIGIIVRVVVYGFLALILLAFFMPTFWPAMSGGVRGRYLRQQKHYAAAFKAGDKSIPLFAMDWFGPTVHFCRVNQSGRGSARRDVGHAIQAGVSISLDQTNLQALVETINRLPPPPKRSLPDVRQIVVGCIRSNQWFRAVYDRADVPSELERIAAMTGAALPWHIPTVQGYAVARATSGGFICAVTEAAIAMAAGDNCLHIWKLEGSSRQLSSPLKLVPGRLSLFEWEHPVAITPDGNTVAAATDYGLYCVDWHKEKVLWKADALEHEGYYGKHLAIGDNGRTLFAAGAHTVERWDLASGEKHAVLIANEPNGDGIVRFLQASRNGRVVIAGFGLHYNRRPQSFAVWDVRRNEAALKFEEEEGAYADLSPDGEWIALSRFGREDLELFKWRTGERKEVRLRNSQVDYSVYWSPDEKRLAAYVDTYPASILIYDTTSWKPIACWNCGRIGQGSEFIFGQNGILYQIRGNEINALDVSSLRRLADN